MDNWIDWNLLSLDEHVKHLENEFKYHSNGYAKSIFELIEFYKANKEPNILNVIKKLFADAERKEWFETYWNIDIHGTVSKPDYSKHNKEVNYYPYAKETLQLLSERDDIKMIMFTSSYPKEIEQYKTILKNDNIEFSYINENPEISSDKGSFGYYVNKYYFNILIDDKAGFNPETDWKHLYEYFKSTEYRPNPEWSMKYVEEYHKNGK